MQRWLLRLTLSLLSLVGCQLATIAIGGPPGVVKAASALILQPDRGPCAVVNPPIVVQGSGFPVGMAIDVVSGLASAPANQPRSVIGRTTVAADGTFTVRGPLASCAPLVPDGTQFVVEAAPREPLPSGGRLPILASATFTKAAAAPTIPGLPNTGSGGMHQRSTWPAGLWLALALALLLDAGARAFTRRQHR